MEARIPIGAAAVALAALAMVLIAGGSGAARADLSLQAGSATIAVDGDNSDWASIPGLTVPMEQIEIPPGADWDAPGPLGPINAVVKAATNTSNIYVLLEVPDDYDLDPADHNLSAALGVMFRIDQPAGPHMGADGTDVETGLGMVDIWHWELDCGAGVMSGTGDPGSGNDPDCNLDDEYATDPETREDDGKEGDNPGAQNSISGVWEHTARGQGAGAAGTWIFEFSRPLQTRDPQDAQFAAGATAYMALAYFDPDEGSTGWSDTGHLQSSDNGWIQVSLPAAAQPTGSPGAATPSPAPGATTPSPAPGATTPSPTAGIAGGPDSGVGGLAPVATGVPAWAAVVAALGAAVGLSGAAAILRRLRSRRFE
jgi:hypothetical protein